jgi:hypothetical protein
MPYVQVVPPSQATGELADAYRYMREVGGVGMIANIVRLFSLRPGSMRRMIRRGSSATGWGTSRARRASWWGPRSPG